MTGSRGPGDGDDAAPTTGSIAVGSVHGTVTIRCADDILWVRLAGEPTGEELLECFRKAQAAGLLRLSMRTVVDVLDFIGVVDWEAIRVIRDMAPWGSDGGASRVAYLSKDILFGSLIKLVGILFRQTRHKLFDDREAALSWLMLDNC